MPPPFQKPAVKMNPYFTAGRVLVKVVFSIRSFQGAMRKLQYCLLFVKVCVNKRSSDKY